MSDTLTCPVCRKTMPWKGNVSGLILAEAEGPNIMVCKGCEAEAEERNRRYYALHKAAPEMKALLEALVWEDSIAPRDEDLAYEAHGIADQARAILAKIRGEE